MKRRRAARALLVDELGRLVLIRRTRPGVAPYLVTPGGGVEPGEDAAGTVARECREELGADVIVGPVVLQVPATTEHGPQVVLLARLVTMDPARATGAELTDPRQGRYDVAPVSPTDTAALAILVPEVLRDLLARDGATLARRAAALSR